MSDKTKFLVKGCTTPSEAAIDRFYAEAERRLLDANLPNDYQVRWIGADETSTRNILEHIRSGQKTGTVSVPWAIERSGQPVPRTGDAIILINFDGTPAVLIRITAIEEVPYGEITEHHTALDGPRVRALEIWKPLHLGYFNMLLRPYDLVVDDDTPISFENFELLYAP
ncbi:MAG: ASCH domain-containing protein [Woeseiaceae bacterium]